MAIAKKAAAKKTTAKSAMTRGRDLDRALVAAMEDYEVKYLVLSQ